MLTIENTTQNKPKTTLHVQQRRSLRLVGLLRRSSRDERWKAPLDTSRLDMLIAVCDAFLGRRGLG